MKPIHAPFILAVAGFAITSCVITEDSGGYGRGPISSSFGIYEVLPRSYVGDAYYHENRYYYGGRYERGDFQYKGRPYKGRYVHGDQQYYGGRFERHGSDGQQAKRLQQSHQQQGRRPTGRQQQEGRQQQQGRHRQENYQQDSRYGRQNDERR